MFKVFSRAFAAAVVLSSILALTLGPATALVDRPEPQRAKVTQVALPSVEAVGLPMLGGCSPQAQQLEKQIARGALTAADIACVLYQAERGDAPAVLEACRIDSVLAPEVQRLLEGRRLSLTYDRDASRGD